MNSILGFLFRAPPPTTENTRAHSEVLGNDDSSFDTTCVERQRANPNKTDMGRSGPNSEGNTDEEDTRVIPIDEKSPKFSKKCVPDPENQDSSLDDSLVALSQSSRQPTATHSSSETLPKDLVKGHAKLPQKYHLSNGRYPQWFSKEYDDCIIEIPSEDGQTQLAIPITDQLNQNLKDCLELEPKEDIWRATREKSYKYYRNLTDRIAARQRALKNQYKEVKEHVKTFPKKDLFLEMHAIRSQLVELEKAQEELEKQNKREAREFDRAVNEQIPRRMKLVSNLYTILMESGMLPQYESNDEAVQIDETNVPFDLKILNEDRTQDLMRSSNSDICSPNSGHRIGGPELPGPDYGAYEAMCKVNEARHKLSSAYEKLREFENCGAVHMEWMWRLQRDCIGRENDETWEELQQRKTKFHGEKRLQCKRREKELRLAVIHGRRWGLMIDDDGTPTYEKAPLATERELVGGDEWYDRRIDDRGRIENDHNTDGSSPHPNRYFRRKAPLPMGSRTERNSYYSPYRQVHEPYMDGEERPRRTRERVENWVEQVSAAQAEGAGQTSPKSHKHGSERDRGESCRQREVRAHEETKIQEDEVQRSPRKRKWDPPECSPGKKRRTGNQKQEGECDANDAQDNDEEACAMGEDPGTPDIPVERSSKPATPNIQRRARDHRGRFVRRYKR